MKALRTALIACLLVLTGMSQNVLADDVAKHNDIVRLMKMTGTLEIANQTARTVFQQMVQQMKKANQKIPERAIQVIEQETVAFFQEIIPDMMNKMVPIYAQHFSHKEIKQLIAFYDTEIGKKTIRVLPQLMQQVIITSNQYMDGVMPRYMQQVKQRLEAEGFTKKKKS